MSHEKQVGKSRSFTELEKLFIVWGVTLKIGFIVMLIGLVFFTVKPLKAKMAVAKATTVPVAPPSAKNPVNQAHTMTVGEPTMVYIPPTAPAAMVQK